VLDEPFAGQDPATREQLWSLIEETRKAQDFAILHAGHDLPWLRRVCSRVLVLESGRLVEDRAGPEPFERLRHPAALDLLRAACSLEESR
jgi:ABC-type glutathione transport system ATPase component